MRNGVTTVLTVDDARLLIDQIRAEAMELVETAPEHVRSEFGFGMVHGFLKAANRFGTLFDEHMAQLEQKEEAFERDFGRTDQQQPAGERRFTRRYSPPVNGGGAGDRKPRDAFGRPL